MYESLYFIILLGSRQENKRGNGRTLERETSERKKQAQHGEAIRGILEHLQGVPIEDEMSTLRFRMGMAEAENGSLRGKIKTMEAIEMITRSQEKKARMEME
nr:hypothetical protein [Tanacetum cinerariifolium]